MSRWPVLAALAAGVLAAAAVLAVSSAPFVVRPAQAGWTRVVRGASSDGVVADSALLVLPGLDRSGPAFVVIETQAARGGVTTVGVAVDGGGTQWMRSSPGAPLVVALPRAAAPGARLVLRRALEAEPPRLTTMRVEHERRRLPVKTAALSLLLAGGLVLALAPRLGTGALALALVLGAALALALTPALVWLMLPALGSVMRLGAPLALLALASAVSATLGRGARQVVASGAALVVAFVFGAWVRWWFLPSAGSWDTEYWKAWTERAATHGLTRVYGDPEPFEPRRFLAQLRGREPLWRVDFHGQLLAVDYPPLAMTLWRWSWLAVCHVADLDAAEARNVAAKLPALLGDVGAVVFVLVTGRRSPRRALWLAALLWALPVSWVNGAVLGYVDSAYEPVMAAGLWAAGLGRAGTSGALLAMAALIKPTALLAAPAAAVALAAVGAPLVRALLAGAAITAATLVPFAVAGTGPAAVAHVSRILSQRQLSGGFANAWWIVGHTVVSWGHGAPAWRSPVTHVPIDAVGVPAAAVGVMLFALSAAFVLRAQRRAPGPQPAALGAAALVLSYGICAIGVHENHPHAVFLLLLATGLPGRRLRLIFAGLAVTYTLGLVALGGLGRFYGPRYMATSGWSAAVRALRLLPGFDLTLVLAVANLALFVWLLWSLRSLLSLCARDVPPPVMPRPQRRKSTAI